MNIFFLSTWPMINTPGYPWAPLGTYRVPLGDAHLGTLEVNFFVYWAIFKISKPTTISGEYVIFFDQVDLFGTPSPLWDEGQELAFFEYLSWKFGYRGTF